MIILFQATRSVCNLQLNTSRSKAIDLSVVVKLQMIDKQRWCIKMFLTSKVHVDCLVTSGGNVGVGPISRLKKGQTPKNPSSFQDLVAEMIKLELDFSASVDNSDSLLTQ